MVVMWHREIKARADDLIDEQNRVFNMQGPENNNLILSGIVDKKLLVTFKLRVFNSSKLQFFLMMLVSVFISVCCFIS